MLEARWLLSNCFCHCLLLRLHVALTDIERVEKEDILTGKIDRFSGISNGYPYFFEKR